jgi:hypothetical protein
MDSLVSPYPNTKTQRIRAVLAAGPGQYTARELAEAIECTTAMVYRVAEREKLILKASPEPRGRRGKFMNRVMLPYIQPTPVEVLKPQTILDRAIELGTQQKPKPTPANKEERLLREAAKMLEEQLLAQYARWGFLP